MKTFRKKYIFNPDNPRYESPNVRTYNCMNTETKEKNELAEDFGALPNSYPQVTIDRRKWKLF